MKEGMRTSVEGILMVGICVFLLFFALLHMCVGVFVEGLTLVGYREIESLCKREW